MLQSWLKPSGCVFTIKGKTQQSRQMMLILWEQELVYLGGNLVTIPGRERWHQDEKRERWMFVKKKKKGQECWAVSFISHSGPKRHIPKGRCVAKPGSSVWMKRKPRMNTAFRQSTHSCCQERWIHTKLSSITGIFILFPRCGVRADMRPLEIWNSSKFYYRFLVVLVNWVSKK